MEDEDKTDNNLWLRESVLREAVKLHMARAGDTTADTVVVTAKKFMAFIEGTENTND